MSASSSSSCFEPAAKKLKSYSSPQQLIMGSYEALINQVDIQAEQILKKHDHNDLLQQTHLREEPSQSQTNEIDSDLENETEATSTESEKIKNKFINMDDIESGDEFEDEYDLDEKLKKRPPSEDHQRTIVHEHVNKVRGEMIDALNQARAETLEKYNGITNKEAVEINEETKMIDEQTEHLERQSFAQKYCFLLETRNKCEKDSKFFNSYLVVVDFYLSSNIQNHLK